VPPPQCGFFGTPRGLGRATATTLGGLTFPHLEHDGNAVLGWTCQLNHSGGNLAGPAPTPRAVSRAGSEEQPRPQAWVVPAR